MKVEFLGRSERSYTNQKGEPRTARNVSVMLESGEVGQLYVSADVFAQAAKFKRGDRVIVHVDPSVFNGQVQMRPGRLEVVPG